MARYYYFLQSGLIGYYTIDEEGNSIYKIFFLKRTAFVASTSAIIKNEPSDFSILPLKIAHIKYPVKAYQLLEKYHDLALFHIRHLEATKKSLLKFP
jgi:hypothetical protein